MRLTFVFNRAPWAFLPVALLAFGCTRLNPDYCDETTPCKGGRVCELGSSTCRVPDAGEEPDAARPDLRRDTAADLGDARNSCASDDDCAAAEGGPTCVRGLCKKCLGANDCKASLVCATDTGRCVECTATEGCLNTPASPVCVQNKCAPCTPQSDACKSRYPETPVCNATGQCVGCIESVRDCPMPARPICTAGTCTACLDDAACTMRNSALPACDGSACVECTDDKHCPSATKPICDVQLKKCVPCTADAQCAKKQNSPNPGVCLAHQDGRCATDAEAIYVRNAPGCSMSAGAGGTAATPFCFSQDGLNGVTATKRVVVLRGPDALTPFTASATGGEVTVVGQSNATIAPGAFVGVRLTAGELYLRGLTVSGSTQTGVSAEADTTLRMNRCSLIGNRGGLLVSNAGFEISNTVIASNKGALAPGTAITYGGVYLKSAVGRPARFRNNTVVDNEAIGLVCAETYAIKSLLAASNAVEQVLGCTPVASKVGGNPGFDPARPYHLMAGSPCVGAGDPTDFPPDDIDGESRPFPAGTPSDCGADEFRP